MDLNVSDLYLPENTKIINNPFEGTMHLSHGSPTDHFGDTTLRLDIPWLSKPKLHGPFENPLSCPLSDDGCRLVLGLGPAMSTNPSDGYPIRSSKDLTPRISGRSMDKCLNNSKAHENDFDILKLGLSHGLFETPAEKTDLVHIDDEGSTSAARRQSAGYMQSLLKTQSCTNIRENIELSGLYRLSPEPSVTTEGSLGLGSSGPSDYRFHPKKCKFEGCAKGARGASGLCIGHGGGQRCQKPGCTKGAESRTVYCKAHGGGRRCQTLGCTKSAEGRTDYCIGHGGGRRCSHPGGCTKAARGKSGLCIRHGGGKRCQFEGCTRSAEGQAGLCISHGGGRRCQMPGCTKGAQGSTMHCKAHGGGRRCIFAGCTRGAEGSTPLCKGHGGGRRCAFEGGGVCPKSVHGGTSFCVAHGGGKRCASPGCTKSARGRTDFCVRHGGGKRCAAPGCTKSAQGSTDFCKAHGGGKRCTYGREGSVHEGMGSCDKFSRGKSGLCAAHGSLLQDPKSSKVGVGIGPGLFCDLVLGDNESSSTLSSTHFASEVAVDTCEGSSEMVVRRPLIPPQVLVPLSMKASSLVGSEKEREEGSGGSSCNLRTRALVIPEGRVHGGGLLSLLGGSIKNGAEHLQI
ncbi:hypothetical protein AMTRI_Chr04g252500 [Amborella trichopoda]